MAVTITGGIAALAAGGLGVSGRTGTVEIRPKHPSGAAPSYGFTSSALARTDPLKIQLTAGGAIPTSTTVLASAALLPAGCVHTVTWKLGRADGGTETIEYDVLIGPDGGTCDLTDPVNRVDADTVPALYGWPTLPALPVYTTTGTP